MDRKIDGYKNRLIEKQMDRKKHGMKNKWIEKQMDSYVDRRIVSKICT